MARLHERLETTLPLDEAFAFVADFANAAQWDPGVAFSERIDTGPLGIGARYRLGVRMAGRVAPMDYRVTSWEPSAKVVLVGEGSGVAATDEISFEHTTSGTCIDYSADIQLRGALRLLSPFVGGAFARIAHNAREGMQRALEARARAGRTPVHGALAS
jgi:carbon monoxide dehydrogenase subunit G